MWHSLYVLTLFLSMTATILLFLDESSFYSLFFNPSVEKIKNRIRRNDLNDTFSKPKYIWLMLDAYASFQSGDLNTYSNHSSFYHIKNTGYPQSAAIASEQFLGKSSRNYVGHFIKQETIFEQINIFPTSIISCHFPIIRILGKRSFSNIKTYNAREKHPLYELNRYNFFELDRVTLKTCYNISEAQQEIIKGSEHVLTNFSEDGILDSLRLVTQRGKNNLVFYSTIMDSFNHNYAAFDNKTLGAAAVLLSDIKGIIKAIENSELRDSYALIVSSDHGGQVYFGEDEICNHGCLMDSGNEGFLFIYSYGTDHFEDWIKNYDVPAIVAQYIKNANIPVHATGWPKPIKNNSDF